MNTRVKSSPASRETFACKTKSKRSTKRCWVSCVAASSPSKTDLATRCQCRIRLLRRRLSQKPEYRHRRKLHVVRSRVRLRVERRNSHERKGEKGLEGDVRCRHEGVRSPGGFRMGRLPRRCKFEVCESTPEVLHHRVSALTPRPSAVEDLWPCRPSRVGESSISYRYAVQR